MQNNAFIFKCLGDEIVFLILNGTLEDAFSFLSFFVYLKYLIHTVTLLLYFLLFAFFQDVVLYILYLKIPSRYNLFCSI